MELGILYLDILSWNHAYRLGYLQAWHAWRTKLEDSYLLTFGQQGCVHNPQDKTRVAYLYGLYWNSIYVEYNKQTIDMADVIF